MKTSLTHKRVLGKVRLILDFYFQGKANASQEAEIQEWLVDDRFVEEKDEALLEMWNEHVKEQEPDAYAKASLAKMRERLGFSSSETVKKELRPARRAILWRSAAAAVLLIGAGGIWFFADKPEEISVPEEILVAEILFQTVSTGDEALQKHVVLPDSSEVWLSRNSRIVYPADFSEGRSVELEGEAQFSVVKQDGNPFTVQGADLHITVLGTEFTFLSREDEMVSEVRLVEGAVEVNLSGDLYRMNPNDHLTFNRETNDVLIRQLVEEILHREIIAPEPEPKPEFGLVFDGVALEEVLRVLCDRFGGTFIVDERIPLWMTVTVKFSGDETLDEMLFVISNTSGIFDYTIQDNQINLIRH